MDLHTQFRLAHTELRKFNDAISQEIEDFNKLASQLEDNQFIRRMKVRIVFSSIEAQISHMKSSAKAFAIGKENLFTEDEYLELLDQRKKSDGRIVEYRPSLKENLKIAFRALAKSIENEYHVDLGTARAKRFFCAADIRNRITHPKSAKDWIVKQSDIAVINDAWIWFGEHLVEVIKISETEPVVRVND